MYGVALGCLRWRDEIFGMQGMHFMVSTRHGVSKQIMIAMKSIESEEKCLLETPTRGGRICRCAPFRGDWSGKH
jgi:hypothetical protein